MNPKIIPLKKVPQSLCLIVFVLLLSKCSEEPKYTSFTDSLTDVAGAKRVQLEYNFSSPPKDVPSQSQDASISELAKFAWLEFVALNWPADSESRGFPDKSKPNGFITSSQVGAATYTPVWQTYWHRNELFPATGKTPVKPTKNDSSKPIYQYNQTYDYRGTGTGNYKLWNNLDEVNELGEDIVFAHSTTSTLNKEYQVLYEAKMNYAGSKYVYDNKLYKSSVRNAKSKATMNSMANQGVCGADPSTYICLPCGDLETETEGNIEIKAAWRKLTTDEVNSKSYHTQNVIYYHNVKTGENIKSYYENATMGLVGLHIIHKTKTFPTYVYATFEHKDNLSSDIVYTELEKTPFGDKVTPGVYTKIERTHPIPEVIDIINGIVELDLASKNSIWQNYKLINVQAKPIDVSKIKPSEKDDPKNSYFYMSNSVIESNKELQTFTGSLTNAGVGNVTYNNNLINMGGCMGCHGHAQQAGTDFNFLIAGAPFSSAETTGPQFGCPSGAMATPINAWSDVKEFFNNCNMHLNNSISLSPHKKFWAKYDDDMKNYKKFKDGYAITSYNGKDSVKICIPGDSTNSNIIKRLKGMGVAQMPGGGPFYTDKQISELAKWIQAGCPYE